MCVCAEVVWELLSAGASPRAVAFKAWTPILAAALAGHCEVVQQLIGAGASVVSCTNKGWNALHMSAQAGHKGNIITDSMRVVSRRCGSFC